MMWKCSIDECIIFFLRFFSPHTHLWRTASHQSTDGQNEGQKMRSQKKSESTSVRTWLSECKRVSGRGVPTRTHAMDFLCSMNDYITFIHSLRHLEFHSDPSSVSMQTIICCSPKAEGRKIDKNKSYVHCTLYVQRTWPKTLQTFVTHQYDGRPQAQFAHFAFRRRIVDGLACQLHNVISVGQPISFVPTNVHRTSCQRHADKWNVAQRGSERPNIIIIIRQWTEFIDSFHIRNFVALVTNQRAINTWTYTLILIHSANRIHIPRKSIFLFFFHTLPLPSPLPIFIIMAHPCARNIAIWNRMWSSV